MTYHQPEKPYQLEDRVEHHSPKPDGSSAQVETTEEVRVTTPPEIGGMGHRMKRKEDPRFLQGRGNYVDDIKLPGMLYMDIVRSPYAHARISDIDASAALEMEGIVAVITGKDLEAHGLHWMPTLMNPIRRWYCQLIKSFTMRRKFVRLLRPHAILRPMLSRIFDVDYEPLEPVVDPFEAMEDKVIVREDKEVKTNRTWHWEAGDKEATDKIFENAAHVVKQYMHIPRIHVASIETCGSVCQLQFRNRQNADLHDLTSTACSFGLCLRW